MERSFRKLQSFWGSFFKNSKIFFFKDVWKEICQHSLNVLAMGNGCSSAFPLPWLVSVSREGKASPGYPGLLGALPQEKCFLCDAREIS